MNCNKDTLVKSKVNEKFLKWIDDQGTESVANLLGVSVRTVFNWRSGHTIPSIPTMLDIINYSNGELTPNDLIQAKAHFFKKKTATERRQERLKAYGVI